jgi:hypothetical protein
MAILIHGKQYYTVADRLKEAGKDLISVQTEVLQHEPSVVVKATIIVKNGSQLRTFTGTSFANINKAIEKTSPYEVAETSAVGRALGFAGYGIDEGIASAEEMSKAVYDNKPGVSSEVIGNRLNNDKGCEVCFAPAGKAHASTCSTLL